MPLTIFLLLTISLLLTHKYCVIQLIRYLLSIAFCFWAIYERPFFREDGAHYEETLFEDTFSLQLQGKFWELLWQEFDQKKAVVYTSALN